MFAAPRLENVQQSERRRRHPLVTVSTLLWIAMVGVFSIRADGTYALTLWPSWFYGIAGLLLLMLAGAMRAKNLRVPVLGWLVFTIAFADAPMSLLRFPWGVAEKGDALRIVSLNCAIGNVEACREAIATGADLILFQESPSEKELEALAKEAFGAQAVWIHGVDCSILTTGVLKRTGQERMNRTWAVWTNGGTEVQVCSLRLHPPLMLLSLWKPDTWSAYKIDRAARRAEVADIMTDAPGKEISIVGGDFNTSPDNSIEEPLIANYSDAFATAGHGWGPTGLNDIPVVRVDHVWIRGMTILRAWSAKTRNSDHRMVIVDVKPVTVRR